jgi:hypothetical protein
MYLHLTVKKHNTNVAEIAPRLQHTARPLQKLQAGNELNLLAPEFGI